MSAATPCGILKRHRRELSRRWLRRYYENNAGAPYGQTEIPPELTRSLVDEILLLLESNDPDHIPRRHPAFAIAGLADFPASVSLCIELMQAGSQVFDTFVVENSGPLAVWSHRTRDRIIEIIDSVFHILAHREIQILCDLCVLPESSLSDGPGRSNRRLRESFSNPAEPFCNN